MTSLSTDPDLERRRDARQRISNLYSPASHDAEFIALLVNTFTTLKGDLHVDMEDEEIRYLEDLARLATDLAAGNGNGQRLPKAQRARLHRLAGELEDLSTYFRPHR